MVFSCGNDTSRNTKYSSLDKISSKIIGENINVQMAVITASLIIMGIILYIVDKKAKSKTDYEHITLKQ